MLAVVSRPAPKQKAAEPGEFVVGEIAVGHIAEDVVGGVGALGPRQPVDVLR